MPSEEQENLNRAETPTASFQLEGAPDVHQDIRSASSQSEEDKSVSVRETHHRKRGKSVLRRPLKLLMRRKLQKALSEELSLSESFRSEATSGNGSPRNFPINIEDAPRNYVATLSLTERDRIICRSPGRFEVFDVNRLLLEAIFKGDWEYAKGLFDKNRPSVKDIITGRGETALHIAAMSSHDQFFEDLVKLFHPDPNNVLGIVDKDGRTALHIAILCGRIRMVKALIECNPNLTQLSDDKNNILFVTSAQVSAHKEIAWFLVDSTVKRSPGFFTKQFAIRPILEFIIAGHYDIVHYLLGKFPCLSLFKETFPNKEGDLSILGVLARADSHFLCKNTLSVLEALIFKCIPVDRNYKPTDERNLQASMNPEDILVDRNYEPTDESNRQASANPGIPVDGNYERTDESNRQPSTNLEDILVDRNYEPTDERNRQASPNPGILGEGNYERADESNRQASMNPGIPVDGNYERTDESNRQASTNPGIPVDGNYERTDERNRQVSRNPVLQCFSRPLWNAAKILVPKIKRIHEKKLRYVAAIELAEKVCSEISTKEANTIVRYFQEESLFRQAIIKGNSDILKICIQSFPEIFPVLPEGKKLMSRAVEYRQERILSLFLKVTSTNELSLVPAPTPEGKREMMLAAVKQHSHFNVGSYISGAAFQMQRELQWFNAVESWLFPGKRVFTYMGKTFWEHFVEDHRSMQEKGEKWVKDTADKCMLVSTLIATVLFAAAFTVPGGYDDKTGVPLLLGQDSVVIFTISNALGLFSSITAILLFLAILTSPYEVEDFLHSLPKKIIMGLSFLFLSLAFMLVAFVATLKISLDKRLEWAFIPITLLASLPVVLFLRQQLPLLLQMVKSTYGPSIFRPEDIWK